MAETNIATQIARIMAERNRIRTRLTTFGLDASNADLQDCATLIEDIENMAAVDVEILEGKSYTIPKGYHNGAGVVKAMTDTEGEAEKYKTQAKSVTPTKAAVAVSSDEGFYALSSVTVNPIPDNYQDVSSVDAAAGDVLATKKYVTADGTLTTGTMPNNGAVTKVLDTTTTSYTIPAGYHNGSGKVSHTLETKTATPTKETQNITPTSGNVLSKVTVAAIPAAYQDVTGVTAEAADVLTGHNFVDAEGSVVAGTMANKTATNITFPRPTITSGTTSSSEPLTIGGYANYVRINTTYENKTVTPTKSTQSVSSSNSKFLNEVTVNPIPDAYQDVTEVTATAAEVLSGSKFVNSSGTVITGTMTNNGATSKTFNGLTTMSVSIPAGYTSGGTVSLTSDIETALAAI